jgi:hypothetical protein
MTNLAIPEAVTSAFRTHGTFVEACPYGSGHINDTFKATFRQGDNCIRYIFQRINQRVFQQPELLMENIARVTAELRHRLEEAEVPDVSRRVLSLVPAQDGRPFHIDDCGRYWRCYVFIESARTYDVIVTPGQAREAARAFGDFPRLLANLPAPRLHETIKNFHHTRSRFESLRSAAGQDPWRRLHEAREEWEFIRARESMVDVLLDLQAKGVVPERVTHNDTKLNNVMLDDASETGICVIDLDTVMPGLALYDFGDMVRTATSPAAEDEKNLSLVHMQMPMFQALVEGYLGSAGGFLNEAEIDHLVFSAKLITLEIGIRFLTDFLDGDAYFKTDREGHNLDRCRTQLALVRSIEQQEDVMRRVVETCRR